MIYLAVQTNGYTKDSYSKDINELIQHHTQRLLESKVYELSASQDQTFLNKGQVPTNIQVSFQKYGDLKSLNIDADESIKLQEERIAALKKQYNISQDDNNYINNNNMKNINKSDINTRRLAKDNSADSLNELLDSDTSNSYNQMKQLYQNKYNRHGVVSVNNSNGSSNSQDKISVDNYLDKWIQNEVTGEAFMNPKTLQKHQNDGMMIHPNISSTTSSKTNLHSQSNNNKNNNNIQEKGNYRDSLDSEINSQFYSQNQRKPSQLNPNVDGRGNELDVNRLRSQSSYKNLKPEVQSDYRKNIDAGNRPQSGNASQSRVDQNLIMKREYGNELKNGEDLNYQQGGGGGEYIYQERFKPSERLPRQPHNNHYNNNPNFHQENYYPNKYNPNSNLQPSRRRDKYEQYQQQIQPSYNPYGNGSGYDGGGPLHAYPQQQQQQPPYPLYPSQPNIQNPYGQMYPPPMMQQPIQYPYNPYLQPTQPSYPYSQIQPPFQYQQHSQIIPNQLPYPQQTQPINPLLNGINSNNNNNLTNPTSLAVPNLNSVAELLEQENSRLAQLGNRIMSREQNSSLPVDDKSNKYSQVKSSVDDILSGLGIDLGTKKDIQSIDSPPKRLTRTEIKHREEMKQIQFEMEKLRMTEALDDMKSELERKKLIKTSEEQHQVLNFYFIYLFFFHIYLFFICNLLLFFFNTITININS